MVALRFALASCALNVALVGAVRASTDQKGLQVSDDSRAGVDASRGCLDVNTADYLEMKRLPGISRGLALRIVMGRTCFFKDSSDLSTKLRSKPGGDAVWAQVKPLFDAGTLCVSCDGAAGRGKDVTAADVNVVTLSQLSAVAGVGASLAESIIQSRQCFYSSLEDLKERVEGTGYSGLDGGSTNFKIDAAWFTKTGLCDLATAATTTTTLAPVVPVQTAEDKEGTLENHLRQTASKANLMAADVVAVKTDTVTCSELKLPHLTIPKMASTDPALIVKCDEGYSLSSHPLDNEFEVLCEEDGLFSGHEDKVCQPVDCHDPTAEFGGQGAVEPFTGSTTYLDGGAVELKCKTGFSFAGKETGPKSLQIVCQATGAWSGQGVECLPIVVETTTREHKCPEGFSFDGEPCNGQNCAMTLTCTSAGCTPEPPVCVPVNCLLPAVRTVNSLKMEPAGVALITYGQKVTFSCGNGFMLTGPKDPSQKESTFICRADGRLIAEGGADLAQKAPTCERVKCGDVKKADWYVKNQAFWSALFKRVDMDSDEFSGDGARLQCKFLSKPSRCLQTSVVDVSYRVVTGVAKQTEVRIRCNANGKWAEPSNLDIQTCAYPLGSKSVGARQRLSSLLPSNEDIRVLTLPLTGSDQQVEVRPFQNKNIYQLWVLDRFGLIRSAANPAKCLTTKDGVMFSWEGYLYLADCVDVTTGKKPAKEDMNHEWWLTSDWAMSVRMDGGSCSTDESCCSLVWKAKSQRMWGWMSGQALTGSWYLTMPQAEGWVYDWLVNDYRWTKTGEVYNDWRNANDEPMSNYVGMRVDGAGNILKAPRGDVYLRQNFLLQSDPFPKVLKSIKASRRDKLLAIVDFWE